jgi:hypothetical protein
MADTNDDIEGLDDFVNDGNYDDEEVVDDNIDEEDEQDDAPSRRTASDEDTDDLDDDKPAPKTQQRTQVQDNTNQQQKPEQQQLFARPDGTATDAKGNIVDPKTGTIIATAGQARRHYEKAARLEAISGDLERRNVDLATQLKRYESYTAIQSQYGVTQQELSQGLGLVADFKTNPVAAARKVVELALAQGYNVSDILGKDAGDAIELRGINRMIDQKLQPFTELHQSQVQQREQVARMQQAQAALSNFFDTHEHSSVHAEDLNTLLGENESLTPEKAYYELRMFAAENGLDFSRPLKPQVAAIANGQQQPSAQNRNPARPTQRPIPNGSRANMQVRNVSDRNFAQPSDDWSKIIKSAMS